MPQHDMVHRPLLKSLSRGPFGLAWSAVVGFLLGSLAFLGLGFWSDAPQQYWSLETQLKIYSACVCAGMFVTLGVAMIGNLVIARRVYARLAETREYLSVVAPHHSFDLAPKVEAAAVRVPEREAA